MQGDCCCGVWVGSVDVVRCSSCPILYTAPSHSLDDIWVSRCCRRKDLTPAASWSLAHDSYIQLHTQHRLKWHFTCLDAAMLNEPVLPLPKDLNSRRLRV
jgi:hypothetical protein